MHRFEDHSGPPSTMPPPMVASIDDGEIHDELYAEPKSIADRRRRLARWVGAVVAVSTALCLAAGVRVAVAKASSEAPEPLVVARAPMPEAAPPPPAQQVAVAAPEPKTSSKPKSAREERDASRRALESGRPKDAIPSGERATSLDATDANAWLVLGAAYQEVGDGAAARKAFASCAKRAKKGPVAECRAMLR